MMPDARAIRFLWSLVTQFIAHRYQWRFVRNSPCYTRCLAKRDQSAAMPTPDYFFIFCVIKNSQKMVYIMDTLCIE